MRLNNDNKFIIRVLEWDDRNIKKYNAIQVGIITKMLKCFSFLGKHPFWLLLIAFYFLIWYNPVLFSFIGVTFLNGLWTNVLIKKIVDRPRPYAQINDVVALEPYPTSRSFPSWHAYNSASQWIVISFIFSNIVILICLFIISIIICFSRIYLGVHYPSDVISGYLFGLVGGLTTIVLFGPLCLYALQELEGFLPYEIAFDQLNPLLGQPLYLLMCFIIYGSLVYITIILPYKKLNEKKKNM